LAAADGDVHGVLFFLFCFSISLSARVGAEVFVFLLVPYLPRVIGKQPVRHALKRLAAVSALVLGEGIAEESVKPALM